MASAREHAVIGAGVATAGWILFCGLTNRQIRLGDVLLAAGVGAIGGVLPDLIEPATTPNHRQFFHSYSAAFLLVQANMWVSRNPQLPRETRTAIHLMSVGFYSHLWADAQTPMRLPLA
jgi:membrane-bound metal-dependent hydrolase YbcI (DUF457 family)